MKLRMIAAAAAAGALSLGLAGVASAAPAAPAWYGGGCAQQNDPDGVIIACIGVSTSGDTTASGSWSGGDHNFQLWICNTAGTWCAPESTTGYVDAGKLGPGTYWAYAAADGSNDAVYSPVLHI